MDMVSVEAFDRTAHALIKVIQEDSKIIKDLSSDNEHLIAGANKAWLSVEKEVLENGDLKNKINMLLELCDEQDRQADKFKIGRDDSAIRVSEVRRILGP